jgi:hypothetical protein
MRLFFLTAALTLAQPLHAADATGEFAIKGAGLQPCGALAAAWDQQTADLGLYLGWIDGYLTGMNQHFDETFDAAPWQTSATLLGLTRELCRNEAGEARIMDVFNALMRDFLPARLRQQSPAQAVRRGDSAVALYTATIDAIERRLAEEGFDPGASDGGFDDATARAVEAFQADRGLEVTGLPDQQTLFALFVRPPR